jgi:hypothetical protein
VEAKSRGDMGPAIPTAKLKLEYDGSWLLTLDCCVGVWCLMDKAANRGMTKPD